MKKKVFVRFLIIAYIAVLLFGIMTIGSGAASSYETPFFTAHIDEPFPM